MTAHSLLGASSAHRWLNCPGSFALSQTAPHRPPSRYAAAGTAAHELIEKSAANGLMPIDAGEIGKTWHVDGHTGTVDQEFIAGVNTMIAYLRQTAGEVITVEHRVELDDLFDPPPPTSLFGTADAMSASLKDPRHAVLEIVDYKNGAGVEVRPDWNPQLLYYAAGAMLEWECFEPPGGWARIRLTVVQPHAGGTPVRSWDLDPIDLKMWIEEVLIPGVRACEKPDAPLVTGDWCRFCPVSHSCPKLAADAVEAAKQEFADDFYYSVEQLAEMLDRAERAELWINRVREFAVEELKRQRRIPGWGLVPTRATRQWLQPDTDIADQLRDLGAGHDEIWETRVRSPAQVEKQLHRTRKGRLIWSKASDLVEARSTGVKLGRDDRTSPQEDFTGTPGSDTTTKDHRDEQL